MYLDFEANRSKEIFTKYVDSVLAKCAKIRSLIGDLQKNYPTDATAKKFLFSI
jgi:hypothetical protein